MIKDGLKVLFTSIIVIAILSLLLIAGVDFNVIAVSIAAIVIVLVGFFIAFLVATDLTMTISLIYGIPIIIFALIMMFVL